MYENAPGAREEFGLLEPGTCIDTGAYSLLKCQRRVLAWQRGPYGPVLRPGMVTDPECQIRIGIAEDECAPPLFP